ncbi:hypothetical protein GCM10011514_06700 [Emticicia aquatilis]|uniref:Site-specific integrase n=1 Tax=Emticicia aquatilis TaxID=1537369 RepID=A0A917DJN7_9BACT|nr:tyrosine-type recombinase/integrase [Emticicia aquatilis]GGD45340.1 hypothetical protein GCM10011514_06700 [Emticicia aquatilis]
MAVKTAKFFDKSIKMADNPKSIPIHPSEPRFVDSTTQPLIIYYIWNIDKQDFVRKRKLIPVDISASQKDKIVKSTIADIKADIKAGYVAYNKKSSAEKYKKDVQEERRLSKKDFTIKEAFDNYIAVKEVSLSESSIKAYKGYKNWFIKFCDKNEYSNLPLKEFSFEQATKFFDEIYLEKSIAAKTHNEIASFVTTVFSYYKKRKVISENPCVHELKVVESEESHHPLTLEQIAKLKEFILEKKGDEQTWLFLNFCYYTCARPRVELRLLKVKNILEDTILITASTAKKNNNRHSIILEALEYLIQKHNLRTYPKDYYVFSADGTPGETPTGKNYFYKRNKEALEACGFTDKEYDLYSWKHTANVQAVIAGTSVYDLKVQNGHKSIQQTEQYLRKIGAISQQEKANLKYPTI